MINLDGNNWGPPHGRGDWHKGDDWVEFHILGPLELRADGRVVRVAGARQRRLLALLLLNANQVVPVERIEDELWTEPPRSVRQQIHNAVGSLRSTVATAAEPFPISRTEVGYQLHVSPESVDLTHFHRLVGEAARVAADRPQEAIRLYEAALTLWRGDALAGLHGKTIGPAAAGLDEQRMAAVEELAELRLATGEATTRIAELSRLVADHPLRETLRGHLMRALHHSGRQAEALAVYEDGRRLLADELGLGPSQDLREIHAAILADDSTRTAKPPAEPVVEHLGRSFLPRSVGDFSGREAVLDQMFATSENRRREAPVVFAVDGMGGVGKTALAVRFGHLMAANHPDGQYFIDLHGVSADREPLTADQALAALLRDSGVPDDRIPDGVDGRSTLWRARTAGKRVLLVLDNAADAAQVRPLLPGTEDALVVVTSRHKLAALEGAVPVALDVLPVQEAIALFSRIVGAPRVDGEAGAVTIVAERCGHLPLAIRIAASRMRDRPQWRVGDLLVQLTPGARRNRFLHVERLGVTAILGMSYHRLSRKAQRLFRLLSLYPGTKFDAGVAAALTGYPVHVAEQCLESLFDENLVLRWGSGCFRFHPMIRDCADEMLLADADVAERLGASRQLGRYLAQVARNRPDAAQLCPAPREPPSDVPVTTAPCAME